MKPYLHTEFLRKCADIIRELDSSINKELSLRKKIVSDRDHTDIMFKDTSMMKSRNDDFNGNESTN
jgi:hypothetical protein